MDAAVTVLPEPLSPTRATVSCLPISRLTPWTTSLWVLPRRKAIRRSRIETRGKGAGFEELVGSLFIRLSRPPWIEGVTDRFADKNQQCQHNCKYQKSRNTEPGGLHICLALG